MHDDQRSDVIRHIQMDNGNESLGFQRLNVEKVLNELLDVFGLTSPPLLAFAHFQCVRVKSTSRCFAWPE